jgi:hypothetical protein
MITPQKALAMITIDRLALWGYSYLEDGHGGLMFQTSWGAAAETPVGLSATMDQTSQEECEVT